MIIETFWLFLPAGVANMAPVLFKWIKFLDFPVDFNKKFLGKRVLGDHKTFRGVFFGTLMAIITAYIENIMGVFDYNPFILGFLLGFGALFGDMVKSFFKRQLNIAPGKMFIPFDQIDWILGSGLFALFYIDLTWKVFLTALVMFGVLHPLINLLGYALKIKKSKF